MINFPWRKQNERQTLKNSDKTHRKFNDKKKMQNLNQMLKLKYTVNPFNLSSITTIPPFQIILLHPDSPVSY